MNVLVYGIDLVSIIFRSAFAHDTQTPTSGFMVWGSISYNLLSHLAFLQDKVNSACYNAQVVNPGFTISLTGRWCAFSAGQCISTYGCCDATCSSWPARFADLSPIEHMWDIKNLRYFFSRACHNHCRKSKGCKMLGTIYRRMAFGTLWPFAMGEYCLHCYHRGSLYIDVTISASLTMTCVIWSEFVFMYSYNDTLLVKAIFNIMNLSLKVLHFFRECILN